MIKKSSKSNHDFNLFFWQFGVSLFFSLSLVIYIKKFLKMPQFPLHFILRRVKEVTGSSDLSFSLIHFVVTVEEPEPERQDEQQQITKIHVLMYILYI